MVAAAEAVLRISTLTVSQKELDDALGIIERSCSIHNFFYLHLMKHFLHETDFSKDEISEVLNGPLLIKADAVIVH